METISKFQKKTQKADNKDTSNYLNNSKECDNRQTSSVTNKGGKDVSKINYSDHKPRK